MVQHVAGQACVHAVVVVIKGLSCYRGQSRAVLLDPCCLVDLISLFDSEFVKFASECC